MEEKGLGVQGMGRTILCPHCKSTINEDILKQKNSENICLVCGGRLDGSGSADAKSDWITWYYYGLKDKKGNKTEVTSLEEKPIDLQKDGDIFYLIKEFQAPPKDENGSCDAAKKELRKYIPDAFPEKKTVPKVQCPYCFSTEVQLVPKKFSLLTGIMTNGFNRVCVRCQRKF